MIQWMSTHCGLSEFSVLHCLLIKTDTKRDLMKNLLTILSIFWLAVAGVTIYAGPDSETLSGEVVDLVCYIGSGLKGPDHSGCAKACVQKGQPMGLVTDEGSVILLWSDSKNTKPYDDLKGLAGSKASVTGKMAERDGMKILTVTAAEGS
jgi:hypothetical protein